MKTEIFNFTNDSTINEENENDLSHLITILNEILLKINCNMKIYIGKTNVIIICKQTNQLEGITIEFSYLGNNITINNNSKRDVVSRILQANRTVLNKRTLFPPININLKRKESLMKVYEGGPIST